MHDIIRVPIPATMWSDGRGNGTKLHCLIEIAGTTMHLEAIQVQLIDDVQQVVNPDLADEFTYVSLYGNEGEFQTTEINGKSYVLVATPCT